MKKQVLLVSSLLGGLFFFLLLMNSPAQAQFNFNNECAGVAPNNSPGCSRVGQKVILDNGNTCTCVRGSQYPWCGCVPDSSNRSSGSGAGGGSGSVDFSKSSGLSNPVLEGSLGTDEAGAQSGSLVAKILSAVLAFVLGIAFLLVLVNLVQAAINWIGSGGDNTKIQKARDQILQSVIGMIILAATFAVWRILDQFLGISLDFSTIFLR